MRELPTCPPRPELSDANNVNDQLLWYSWNNGGRRVLYHGAPFAVVRWTNMWFPLRFGVWGDWFGAELRPLFGNGVVDLPLVDNRSWRFAVPAWPHALYYHFQSDERPESVTGHLRQALDLASTGWLAPTVSAPPPDPRSG